MTKNIGGSILPSSCPEIMRPIKFNAGELIVKPIEERDTHALIYSLNGRDSEIASHPNGYSCRALAERIVKRDNNQIREQSNYIVRCGGKSLTLEQILAAIHARE